MPELERGSAPTCGLPNLARRYAHRIVLDYGDRAEVVAVEWGPRPALGQLFGHRGQRWRIVQERPHARVWVAAPAAD